MTNQGSGGVEHDAIRGINSKLARAQKHLDRIQNEMDAYWKRKPIVIVSQFNDDSTEYVSHLRIMERPPIEWAVRFGEAVHNMRSALDHCVYQLTIAHEGRRLEMTGFPIFKDSTSFEGSGRNQIRGLLPAAQAVIEGLQPYNDPNPEDTVLWSLHDAWNQDKHRIISLMAAVPTTATATVTPLVVYKERIFNGVHEDGAKIAHFAFDEPSPHVKVRYELSLQIVDKNTWKRDKPATVTYEETLGEVASIINNLLAMMI